MQPASTPIPVAAPVGDISGRSITEFKVVYICPDHNEKYHRRKLHMDELLKHIGFTDIVHYKSGTEAYPECLARATIDILKAYMDEPILLLEDDVEWVGIRNIEIPASADAIYLGISKYGGSLTQNINAGNSSWVPWSATQVRLRNMLSTHAILYLTPQYKQAVIDALSAHAGVAYNTDVLISRIQHKYVVLANKHPLFYQSARFNSENNVQGATYFNIH